MYACSAAGDVVEHGGILGPEREVRRIRVDKWRVVIYLQGIMIYIYGAMIYLYGVMIYI